MDSTNDALSLRWVFGLSKSGIVHNLSDEDREFVFYAAAHTGVLFDLTNGTQQHLIGHTNEISCTCISDDKRWIATGDRGDDSLIIIWDSFRAAPIKTFSMPHKHGVSALALSSDGSLLASLSAVEKGETQELAIWDWSAARTDPVIVSSVQSAYRRSASNSSSHVHTMVQFSAAFPQYLVSCGPKSISFWSWDEKGEVQQFPISVTSKEFKHTMGTITCATFVPDSLNVVTSTSDGDLIIWQADSDDSILDKKSIKVVRLHDASIQVLAKTRDYLVTGGADGLIRFFDFQLKLVAWFEDLNAGAITAISFANKHVSRYEESSTLFATDFVVTTAKGMVLTINPKLFEQQKVIEGSLIFNFQDGATSAIATHPTQDLIAIGGSTGLNLNST